MARNTEEQPDRLAQFSDRVRALKQDVDRAKPGICPERALLWTAYAKNKKNRGKHPAIQTAEALSHVLDKKTLAIYPGELLAGNFTSRRVGGMIQPELAGFTALLEIFTFPTRKENPLEISRLDMLRLARILPFWLTRNMAFQACPSPALRPAFILRNARLRDWVINELGGIAHFAPDHARILAEGVEGILSEARERQKEHAAETDKRHFLSAVIIAGEGLARFGERYAVLATRLAETETNSARKEELLLIAQTCRQVPRHGARTFHEALQSMLLTHIAIVHEGLDVSICPGRMDQILFPYYKKDLAEERITPEAARELLACFCIKLCETVPVWSKMVNGLFSGLPSYQTVCVGGTDRNGKDAVNDLSYMLLDIMDGLRMRQPNFHARVHKNSPKPWLDRVYQVLAQGANSPALYNDDVIVPTLVRYGVAMKDARDYTPIGCVEPACQGKSFASTDAALVNVPAALECALNGGRRLGERLRSGARTMPVSRMRNMDDLCAAFSVQLEHQMNRLIQDLRWAEQANAKWHPTPLSSMLIDGCIRSGRDVTEGGAVYNSSGVQCVGPADVGDSLTAVEQLVFQERRLTLPRLVKALHDNIPDEVLRANMRRCDKFGNDEPGADRWTDFVVREFARVLESHGQNTRGGRYVTGLYSTTTHVRFGRVTGALPNGRRRGEPFTSGMAPVNGMDKKGPTAVLNSMNRVDYAMCPNGVNFNIKFASSVLAGKRGAAILQSLMQTYFGRGGMQAQLNVLDSETLKRAKDEPEMFPNLLVRVSGYSAYFNDLSGQMQDEIIARTANELG